MGQTSFSLGRLARDGKTGKWSWKKSNRKKGLLDWESDSKSQKAAKKSKRKSAAAAAAKARQKAKAAREKAKTQARFQKAKDKAAREQSFKDRAETRAGSRPAPKVTVTGVRSAPKSPRAGSAQPSARRMSFQDALDKLEERRRQDHIKVAQRAEEQIGPDTTPEEAAKIRNQWAEFAEMGHRTRLANLRERGEIILPSPGGQQQPVQPKAIGSAGKCGQRTADGTPCQRLGTCPPGTHKRSGSKPRQTASR